MQQWARYKEKKSVFPAEIRLMKLPTLAFPFLLKVYSCKYKFMSEPSYFIFLDSFSCLKTRTRRLWQ